MTSIAGLVASILFSWREKSWVHKFDDTLAQWVIALDQRLRRVTQESLADEQLKQSRQQTRVMEGFTDQLAFQIAEALDSKVTQSLMPQFDKLITAIEGMRQDRQGSNEALLEKLLTNFSAKLSGSAGTEMDSLAKTLRELQERTKEQVEAANKRDQGARQTAEQVIEQLNTAFIDGNARMSAILDQAHQDLRVTTENMVKVSSNSADMLKGSNEVIASLMATNAALTKAISTLSSTTDKLSDTGEKITNSSASIADGVSQTQRAIETLRDAQVEVRNDWDSYQSRFDHVDTSLAKTFTKLDEGLAGFMTQVQGYMEGLDGNATQVVALLSGAVSELNDSIEDLQDTLRSRP
jgi:uncharacterized phage infection (PIP) family protein YhgE